MPPRQTNPAKEKLFLCSGPACHLRGGGEVLPELQRLIYEFGLESSVELKGEFCLHGCDDGVSLKHRDRLFQHIKTRNLRARFVEEILPSLQKHARKPPP